MTIEYVRPEYVILVLKMIALIWEPRLSPHPPPPQPGSPSPIMASDDFVPGKMNQPLKADEKKRIR
jgi:hypothetical protein